MGKGLVFKWSAAPHPNGEGSQQSPNFGVLFHLCIHPLSQTTRLWGKSMNLGVSHASHPKRAEIQGSPILGVLLYLCLQCRTIKFGMVTHIRRGVEVSHAIAFAQMHHQ